LSEDSRSGAHLEAVSTVEHDRESMESLVFEWRLEELQRAGYSSSQARALAAAKHVDLRLAVRLLADGCPPATATRILA
jgi:hypothetical protein